MAEEYSRNGSKLVWWLMGIFAATIFLGLGTMVSSIVNINNRLNSIEILASSNLEKVKYLEETSRNIIPDKLDYITKHGELVNKISGLETQLKLVENRISIMSERLLTINTRIDSLSFQDKVEERIKGREIK